MSYHHLTPFERGRIETLSKENYSITEISKRLHRNKSTISRELKRLDKESYQAEKEQIHYQSRRQTVGRKSLATTSLLETIQEKLADTWSPEQIAERFLEGKLSFKRI